VIDIMRLPAKPLLIVGGYGYRNAGDEAILAGLLEVTGRDGVTVVSRSPAETAASHGAATAA
jgi:polysaccharide pyruvyl transferase WcaK-like protein